MIVPRALTNALLCALLFCFLLALLVVDLNINLDLTPGILFQLTLFLMPTYGLLVTLAVLIVYSTFRFFSGRKTKPGFVSPPFLMLGMSFLILAALVIFRENQAYFHAFFMPGFQAALKVQTTGLFIVAVLGLVAHYYYRHQKPRRLYLIVYFVLLFAVLAAGVWKRLEYPSARRPARSGVPKTGAIGRRVTLIGLEGLSFETFLWPLAQEGKLPNFSMLMENGGWGLLKGFTPNDPFILRRSLFTGKYPGKHRAISSVRYSLTGLKVKLEIVPRFILFRQLTRLGLLKIHANTAPPRVKDLWGLISDYSAPALSYEPTVEIEVRPSLPAAPTDKAAPEPKPPAGPATPPPGPAKPASPEGARSEKLFLTFFKDFQFESSPSFDQVKAAFLRDAELEERAFLGKTEKQPRVFSLILDGLTTTEAYFYKYAQPDAFGAIKGDEIAKYGSVIQKYYQFYDQIIGKYAASLKDDELLVVYSPFGIEPLPFWKRIVEWMLGNSAVSAYHEQAPDGLVFFKGNGVVQARNLRSMRLVDILPTILYYMRLPAGKDMDGVVRGSLFTREFTDENPLFSITSYEDYAETPAAPVPGKKDEPPPQPGKK